MNTQLLIVLVLLCACIGLFIINKPRMDVVALCVIILLPLCGIMSVQEALLGFSDTNVVLIGALFIVGEGLSRTGISFRVGDWLLRRAGNSETRLVVLLIVAVVVLGSMISSTGIVAIFIPVVLSCASRMRVPPSRLMMTLSFAALISGMQTLVSTPPNMMVDSALRREGFEGLKFFSYTPIGLVVLVLGVGYMLVARHWLNGTDKAAGDDDGQPAGDGALVGSSQRRLQDFITDYQLEGRAHRARVKIHSPLVGLKLRELTLRQDYGANIVAVERRGRFSDELREPNSGLELRDGDVLLIDLFREGADIAALCRAMSLEPLAMPEGYFTDESRAIGMAEVLLPPDSGIIGKTVPEAALRRRYGLNVVGLRRGRKALGPVALDQPFHAGDTLLVIGSWKAIRRLQRRLEDFLVLTMPAESEVVAPALSRAPYALLSLAVMVGLMVTGIVPNVIAALLACLLMGVFRCVDLTSAYKSIHWPSLVLIAGMIPFALALERTGGVDIAVNGLVNALGDSGPRVLLGGLFFVTVATTLFISNTATAVLMAPVAVTLATRLEVSPLPFAITVALAASTAFSTPVASPVNMLVLGPGGYRFIDFVKVGLPFSIVVLLVCMLLVPLFFPM
ncbi:citrate transporter [Cephaloticoccus capnophilus]|uniref:Citrate transporter n=1 Tax=Cephaloticoccus capnophilus TaxID=1548208 RepID=A0A139SID3_9BACT|nr:SLC13 family permease [Cephaloticoccus capnophilus]KXU34307.1 citrate transporter [Cephaloticoccus capnophilus]